MIRLSPLEYWKWHIRQLTPLFEGKPLLRLEYWKPYVAGYYEVSCMGTVRSLDRIVNSPHNTPARRKGVVCKPVPDTRGYEIVYICVRGSTKVMRVHRIVALVFHSNEANRATVNHIDRNRRNNRASNLEWATQKENIAHANWAAGRAPEPRKPSCNLTAVN